MSLLKNILSKTVEQSQNLHKRVTARKSAIRLQEVKGMEKDTCPGAPIELLGARNLTEEFANDLLLEGILAFGSLDYRFQPREDLFIKDFIEQAIRRCHPRIMPYRRKGFQQQLAAFTWPTSPCQFFIEMGTSADSLGKSQRHSNQMYALARRIANDRGGLKDYERDLLAQAAKKWGISKKNIASLDRNLIPQPPARLEKPQIPEHLQTQGDGWREWFEDKILKVALAMCQLDGVMESSEYDIICAWCHKTALKHPPKYAPFRLETLLWKAQTYTLKQPALDILCAAAASVRENLKSSDFYDMFSLCMRIAIASDGLDQAELKLLAELARILKIDPEWIVKNYGESEGKLENIANKDTSTAQPAGRKATTSPPPLKTRKAASPPGPAAPVAIKIKSTPTPYLKVPKDLTLLTDYSAMWRNERLLQSLLFFGTLDFRFDPKTAPSVTSFVDHQRLLYFEDGAGTAQQYERVGEHVQKTFRQRADHWIWGKAPVRGFLSFADDQELVGAGHKSIYSKAHRHALDRGGLMDYEQDLLAIFAKRAKIDPQWIEELRGFRPAQLPVVIQPASFPANLKAHGESPQLACDLATVQAGAHLARRSGRMGAMQFEILYGWSHEACLRSPSEVAPHWLGRLMWGIQTVKPSNAVPTRVLEQAEKVASMANTDRYRMYDLCRRTAIVGGSQAEDMAIVDTLAETLSIDPSWIISNFPE